MNTTKMHHPLEKLKALGISLPTPSDPVANYVPFSRSGNLLFISGQLPIGPEGIDIGFRGKLGLNVTLENGQAAARLATLNLLSQAAVAVNDLSKIRAIRISGFVNCTPDYAQIPQVMNGASDFLIAALDENGKHARIAVGVAQLPLNAAVEVEGIFEILA